MHTDTGTGGGVPVNEITLTAGVGGAGGPGGTATVREVHICAENPHPELHTIKKEGGEWLVYTRKRADDWFGTYERVQFCPYCGARLQ